MQVQRFLKLVEWGFNVPLFVVNPNSDWKDSTYQFLVEHFHRPKTLAIIASQKDGDVSFYRPNLPLRTIFVESVVLEYKYDIIITEDVACEFKGCVTFNEDGTGAYIISEEASVRFGMAELVEGALMRCILRTLGKVLEEVEGTPSIHFGWATRFCGVKKSRLVVFDYNLS